jgi:hypothetical protein
MEALKQSFDEVEKNEFNLKNEIIAWKLEMEQNVIKTRPWIFAKHQNDSYMIKKCTK